MSSTKIDVLDHGYVRLVSYMQPVPLEQGTTTVETYNNSKNWTGDLEIVRNARTSYNADWRATPEHKMCAQENDVSKDAKLINYLYQHRHTSPFEAMVFTFEVQAPIFVFRQWHRHRTWSYNEVSARYTELPDLFYVPKPEHIGVQSAKNKQGRELVGFSPEEQRNFRLDIDRACKASFEVYRSMLDAGVSREIARMVLPVNIYSRMFTTMNLRNLFHFLELRLDSHAQMEIRVYAEALLQLVRPICPIAVGAFEKGLGL